MVSRLIPTFILVFASATCLAENQTDLDDAGYLNLKNFALSHCLAQGFSEKKSVAEAQAAAGAYVELGNMEADAYADASALAKEFLNKQYSSKQGAHELTVMKCLDLMNSRELALIAKKYQHIQN